MAASKPASTRARRNKTSTRATLSAVPNPTIPDLPDHTQWHPAVQQWWRDAWSSPMAPEWTQSDEHTLFLAAQMMQQVWDVDVSPASRVTSATEARQLLRECGLTPMSRRSLQWEIEKVDEAQDRGAKRRAARKDAPKKVSDPRQGMHSA